MSLVASKTTCTKSKVTFPLIKQTYFSDVNQANQIKTLFLTYKCEKVLLSFLILCFYDLYNFPKINDKCDCECENTQREKQRERDKE